MKYKAVKIENGDYKVVDVLYLFKKGIKPMWEDPQNCKGGSIVIEMDHLESE